MNADRTARGTAIIAHQLPIEHWHAWLGNPMVADAILERLMQHFRCFSVDGESGRTRRAAGKTNAAAKEAES
ncbi:ATP-binding protein [Roseateles sp.]|uniref:ATP-binding protein n=1 Tax=Roseateles sp. TaxID=1971397 RepID=UPI0039EBC19C